MVILKIDDLAELLCKTREEVEEILKSQDVIELKLSERKQNPGKNKDELGICELPKTIT